jgi:hypothetical protein
MAHIVNAERLLWTYDLASLAAHAVHGCVIPGVLILTTQPPDSKALMLCAEYAAVVVLHGASLLLMWGLRLCLNGASRDLLLAISRMMMLQLLLSTVLKLRPLPLGPTPLVFNIVVSCGAYHLAWHALMMPLAWGRQALLQAALVIYTGAFQDAAICNRLGANPSAAAQLRSLWVDMERFHSLLSDPFQHQQPPPARFNAMCFPVLIHTQLFVGCLCPLLIQLLVQYHVYAALQACEAGRSRQRAPGRRSWVFAWLRRLHERVPAWCMVTCVIGASTQLLAVCWQLSNAAALKLL